MNTIKRIWTAALVIAATSTIAHAQIAPGSDAGTRAQIQNSIPQYVPAQMNAKTAQLWPNGIEWRPADYFQQPYIQPDLRAGYKLNYEFTFYMKARDLYGKTVNVPDGWYLFTAAILKKDTSMIFNRPQPTSVYERFVTATAPMAILVSGGEITTPVSFRFDDLAPIALANLLYVELLPLKEQCEYPSKAKGKVTIPCIALKENGKADMSKSDVSQLRPGFRPYLAQMSFIPFRSKDSAKPVINDENNPFGAQTLASFVVEARRLQERNRVANSRPITTPKAYADTNKMRLLNVGDAELQAIGRKWKNDDIGGTIQALLDERALGTLTVSEEYRRKIMPAICEYLYRKNSATAAQMTIAPNMMPSISPDGVIRICGNKDAPNITLSRVIHVGKVDTRTAPQISMNPQLNYNVMNNFIVSRSRTRDFTRTFTGKPTNLLLPFFKAVESTVGVAVPMDFTYSVSESNNQSKSEAQMASLGESMDFNPIGLVFNVAQAQVCLQVAVAPLRGSIFYDQAPNARNGLYICGAPRSNMKVEEIYAHVFTSPRDSSVNRAFEAASQTLNLSLRGDRDLSAFFISMRSNLSPVHGPEIYPSTPSNAVQNAIASTPMVTPNVISNPIGFEKGYQPSLVQMALWQYKERFMEEQASR